jgi:hypothetical protein
MVVNENWSSFINIPAFYNFNFDDDRVLFNKAAGALFANNKNYNKNITLYVNKRAAGDFLNLLDSKDLKKLNEIAQKGSRGSLTRGHMDWGNTDLYLSIKDFIFHGAESIDSPLHQAHQKRLYDVFKKLVNTSGSRDVINSKNLQQFLSNLTSTQAFIEQQRRIHNDNFKISKEEIIQRHMQNINRPQRSLFNLCMEFEREHFNFTPTMDYEKNKAYYDDMIRIMKLIIGDFTSEEKKEIEESDDPVCGYVTRSPIHMILEKIRTEKKEGAFIEEVMRHPDFTDYQEKKLKKDKEQFEKDHNNPNSGLEADYRQ